MKEVIFLREDRCVGCNKCIRNCPIMGANLAYYSDGKNKVRIDEDRCIHCGSCIDSCDHEARDFHDDTENFFKDLTAKKSISLIVAPSIRINFPNYKNLLGYLKSLGANVIYDVSLGADITTWAYLKYIKETKSSSIIAQPCPSIVNYVEKYHPELLTKLAPINSPMMCTATYMKKYFEIVDDIAFLSPCISKTDEINDVNTNYYVKYNVTFKKLKDYIDKNKINLQSYDMKDFDDIGSSLGFLFSRPGGLKENVEAKVKGAWIRQIEGKDEVYDYLDEYSQRVKTSKPIPLLVDILNCKKGCNFGTGTCTNCSIDDADYTFNSLKVEKLKEKGGKLTKKIDWLYSLFDKKLKLEDFIRNYSNNKAIGPLKEPSEKEYDSIFKEMHKNSKKSRNLNCSACGYGTCKEMAKAIYNKLNTAANCIDYNQMEVLREKEELSSKNQELDVLEELNKLSEEKLELAEKTKEHVLQIIEAVKESSLGIEEGSLNLDSISREIHDILITSNSLKESASDIRQCLDKFKNASAEIINISDKTNLISLNAAIEAAREEHAGKSFSVVASEIKKLSYHSKEIANSTRDDEKLVEKLLSSLDSISKELEDKMYKVDSNISQLSAALEEIAAKGEEIANFAKNLIN